MKKRGASFLSSAASASESQRASTATPWTVWTPVGSSSSATTLRPESATAAWTRASRPGSSIGGGSDCPSARSTRASITSRTASGRARQQAIDGRNGDAEYRIDPRGEPDRADHSLGEGHRGQLHHSLLHRCPSAALRSCRGGTLRPLRAAVDTLGTGVRTRNRSCSPRPDRSIPVGRGVAVAAHQRCH